MTTHKPPPKRANQDEDAFLAIHGVTFDPDEFFEQESRREKARRMQDTQRIGGRTTPVAIRLDQFTLRRLKTLAALRNTGYQTLLKEFVVERLYEEERREGIID
jgi:predicted DNA binding CopG/RHH family protein